MDFSKIGLLLVLTVLLVVNNSTQFLVVRTLLTTCELSGEIEVLRQLFCTVAKASLLVNPLPPSVAVRKQKNLF